MNIPKIRTQIFLSTEELNQVNKYGSAHGCRTISIAISGMMAEWRRFRHIALKLQEKNEIAAVKKAKVIKSE